MLTWKTLTLWGLTGLVAMALIFVAHGRSRSADPRPEAAGIGIRMLPNAAYSATVATAVGGVPTQSDQFAMLGDIDGREDLVADHSLLVADLGGTFANPAQFVTRVAISEHTIANGFAENIFYYGDSVGNVTVGAGDTTNDGAINTSFTINLPTALNAFGSLESNSQIVITGLAVSPVADLTSFPNVNGGYVDFDGEIGEILYVAFNDTHGGLRLTFNGQIVRSGVLAYPVADVTSPAAAGSIVSPLGFPVEVGTAFGVVFSVFSNPSGVVVDDDGNAYFQQADLINKTGGNIVKITRNGTNQDRSLATSGIATLTTLNPTNGDYGTASGPSSQVNHFTNYSGTAPLFGNIAALATGPSNVLYAAVARSFNPSDRSEVRVTEGPFMNPALLGSTPSMIISFADAVGGTNGCFESLPAPDGFADVIVKHQPLRPGINNFQAFVLGTGPDRRGSNPAFGTTANTQKISFQIDYSVYSGLVVDEEGKVYVVSGGTPAGVGTNPSPNLGEMLLFPDDTPYDRRADYIDLRGDVVPNPGVTNQNIGNGKSNRFDHIFWQAPLDANNLPVGIAGLARGFLLYTNRTRPASMSSLSLLPNGGTQDDDSTAGPIFFEDFDASHQVAGGDDQNFPFRGDDSDGFSAASDPSLTAPLEGGFEYSFAADVSAACTTPWNSFFLNSNGNVTFGSGDTSNTSSVSDFLTEAPRVAGAWSDLNPESREDGAFNTFPVQALGFANINNFKIRWINVPEFGEESCGSRNSLDIFLYDDGTGIDENATQPLNPANPIGNNAVPFDLNEGPTDLRFKNLRHSAPPRPDGSGWSRFHYGRMDLIGSSGDPVMVGYSIGDQAPSPPGLCTSDDLGKFPIGKLIGDGTQGAVFEFFNSGTASNPAFDLRFEGANRMLASPSKKDLSRDMLLLNPITNCSTTPTFSCPK